MQTRRVALMLEATPGLEAAGKKAALASAVSDLLTLRRTTGSRLRRRLPAWKPPANKRPVAAGCRHWTTPVVSPCPRLAKGCTGSNQFLYLISAGALGPAPQLVTGVVISYTKLTGGWAAHHQDRTPMGQPRHDQALDADRQCCSSAMPDSSHHLRLQLHRHTQRASRLCWACSKPPAPAACF
jgi:hypothetical protein